MCEEKMFKLAKNQRKANSDKLAKMDIMPGAFKGVNRLKIYKLPMATFWKPRNIKVV